MSSCFLRWFCFLTFPLHFPLLKLFYFLNEFLLFRILRNAQFPKIYDAFSKPNKKVTQTIFQGGSPWATLIHNSLVCLRVHYCVQLLPEVMFFQPFPLPFPLLKFVSFYLASLFLESKPKAFQRISFSQAKKTWMIMIHNSMVCLRVHYCVQLLPEVILFFNIPFTFSFAKAFFIFSISFFF